MPPQVSAFLYSLLSMKVLHFTGDDGKIISRNSKVGLTQGSVLSPLMFNIYINEIDQCIDKECFLIQFADDSVLYAAGKDNKTISMCLQLSVTNLSHWAMNLGLEFSVPKTEHVVFSNKKPPSQPKITLYNQPMQQFLSFKYLGVWFDQIRINIQQIC